MKPATPNINVWEARSRPAARVAHPEMKTGPAGPVRSVVTPGHLIVNTHLASVSASAGVTALGGMAMAPQTPEPPFWIFSASFL